MDSYTVEKLREKFGTECNLCAHFDLENSKCGKGHRPREYVLEDGPNEFCYARKKCKDFEKYAPTAEDILENFRNNDKPVIAEASRV
jgi:hypothetical protein